MVGQRALLAGLTALAILAGPLAPPAFGADAVATENVTARLVSETRAATPGSATTAGLLLEIRPGWHTYWKNPGDSGEEIRIEWSLPEGVTAGDIQWPAPHRFQLGPVVNHGYSDRVLLPVEITLPASWPENQPMPLKAHATWLVCEDICIPEEATLELALPVGAAPGTPDPRWAEAFATARAALPTKPPGAVDVTRSGDRVRLAVEGAGRVDAAHFFADNWGVTNHAAPQEHRVEGDALLLNVALGDAPPAERLAGVLTVERPDGGRAAWRIEAPITLAPAQAADPAADLGLLAALAMAFLGGLLLNLMPCVFPILSMKALAVVRHGGGGAQRAHGLAYAAGVIAAFLALGGILLAVRAGGAAVGWGFHLQDPLVVAALALVMFAVGLSFNGVLTPPAGIAGIGGELAARSGLAGSFATGLLAVVVAAPCTAPFMGAALGYAFVQPAGVVLAVMAALGLGLALPMLLVTTIPACGRMLPRPGAWMERLRQFLAFPMYGAAAWLAWVLALQAGADALLALLIGMIALAMGAWLLRERPAIASRGGRAAAAVAAVLALAVTAGTLGWVRPAPERPTALAAEAFSPDRLAALRAEGKPVFVNMTAAWCITCLANEKVALSSDSVAAAFRERGVTYLKGDWTRRDAAITHYLGGFARTGVPLYVLYPAGQGAPVVLPQILTEAMVVEALTAATTGQIASPARSTPQERRL